MAAEISLKPDYLRTEAQVYLDAALAIEAEKDRVRNKNYEIGLHWKGKAFDAYLRQFDQVAKHVAEFNELLASINRQLLSYADTLEARDDADQAVFGF